MKPNVVVNFPDDTGRYQQLAFGRPDKIFTTNNLLDVKSVIHRAEECAKDGNWLVGYVSYDSSPAFDSAFVVPKPNGELPLVWFASFRKPIINSERNGNNNSVTTGWMLSKSQAEYNEDINTIKNGIKSGDFYQVNHTLRLFGELEGDDYSLFNRLSSAQPNSYAAYLNIGEKSIISISPELFFRRDNDLVTVKPMKGTWPRGRWYEEDCENIEKLYTSPKNRAENLMIVDLLRNDLSRISDSFMVTVPELFSIERYSSLLQMTSTVQTIVKKKTSITDIFTALFPCGSITGAPKIKSMEMIARLENHPRGIYCGSIGLIKPGGNAIFNVAIRTITMNHTSMKLTYGVGSGITFDSLSDDEYSEILLKSKLLSTKPVEFDLFETIKLKDGELIRLKYHISRLKNSARYFNFPFDDNYFISTINKYISDYQISNARIKLTLDRNGHISISNTEIPYPICDILSFSISDNPINSNDPLIYHKTTLRNIYDDTFSSRKSERDFDVLMWNEKGEVTEFTRGNLIIELNGKMLTPRLNSGLLNGCLRQEMLSNNEVIEASIRVEDLKNASSIWFINSLRGKIRLNLSESAHPI